MFLFTFSDLDSASGRLINKFISAFSLSKRELENKIRFTNLEKAKTEDPWELISKPTLVVTPVAPNKKMIVFASSLIGFIAGPP